MFQFDDLVGLIAKGFFTSDEIQEFREFIITQCTSTPTDINWLTKIFFECIETADYLGYWRIDYDVSSNGIITNIKAVIVLNIFYLRTLERLKKTFAHEYGHHWTLSYLVKSQNIQDLCKFRLPDEYYLKRSLNSSHYTPDYNIAWCFCDKEVIAEDYRVLFTPYKGSHRMTGPGTPNNLPDPSLEIADYIWNLAKPSGWM